jgi:SseB protein N-terminal domain
VSGQPKGSEHRAGAHLNPGDAHQQFRGDDGAADPVVAHALAAYEQGEGSEHAVLTALASSRLLVPVVAILAEQDQQTKADKSSEMALPTLIGQDGRPAIIAFTSVDALARWREDARPVPAEADRVWQGAVSENAAVVIDLAGPVQVVVEGARLAALASGQPVPAPHEDPDIHAEITAVIENEAAIKGARLSPGSAAMSTDLSVELLVNTEQDWEPPVRRAAEEISARLSMRLSRGVEITAMG